MPGGAPDAHEEHLYGAQEAARFLGIHRSTLHLAVKRNILVPDSKTPGGHLRFRRETLDAFAVRLAHEAVTSTTSLLSSLGRTLTLPNGPQEFCHLAVARIRETLPDLSL